MTLGRVVGTIASSKKLSARSASIIWSLSLSFALIVLSQISETAPRATFLLILVIAIFFAGPCYGFIIGQAVSQYEESLAVKSSTLFVLIGSLGGVLIPTLSQIALGSQSKDVLLGAAVAAALSTAFLTMSFREKESTYHRS